jgi:tetratricopeptide (TPR) repeat protein
MIALLNQRDSFVKSLPLRSTTHSSKRTSTTWKKISIGIAGLLLFCTTGASANSIYSIETTSSLSYAEKCYESAANSFYGQNYDREAISHCNRAIRFSNLSDQEKAKTYINRGVLLENMHRIKYAHGDLKRAQRHLRRSGELQINIGNIEYMRGHFQQALARFNRALELKNEDSYKAYLNRGLTHERLGNLRAAANDYRNALKLNPDLDNAKNKLNDATLKLARSDKDQYPALASL